MVSTRIYRNVFFTFRQVFKRAINIRERIEQKGLDVELVFLTFTVSRE